MNVLSLSSLPLSVVLPVIIVNVELSIVKHNNGIFSDVWCIHTHTHTHTHARTHTRTHTHARTHTHTHAHTCIYSIVSRNSFSGLCTLDVVFTLESLGHVLLFLYRPYLFFHICWVSCICSIQISLHYVCAVYTVSLSLFYIVLF